LTKSHVDVWVSANRVCSGRARRLVAQVTRPRRHGLVQTGRISANRRGVSLSKATPRKATSESHDSLTLTLATSPFRPRATCRHPIRGNRSLIPAWTSRPWSSPTCSASRPASTSRW
jgi:hypothetical protein